MLYQVTGMVCDWHFLKGTHFGKLREQTKIPISQVTIINADGESSVTLIYGMSLRHAAAMRPDKLMRGEHDKRRLGAGFDPHPTWSPNIELGIRFNSTVKPMQR